jgi:uncharacterized protein with NRDE domain
MCLLAIAADAHPAHRLVLAANRDEFHARPASQAAWWPDAPQVLAGRDLSAAGTWLGIARDGRWAALTNIREPERPQRMDAPSRGALVADYLRGGCGAEAYMAALAAAGDRWNGFNLVCGDARGVWWMSNRADGPRALQPGVYAVSNALLDTPWPKVERIRGDLRGALEGPAGQLEDALFRALARRDPAPDGALPDTGVGMERERALSSAFIDVPGYGTRASTVLSIDSHGRARFTERSWRPGASVPAEVRYEFPVEAEEATTGEPCPHPPI